MREILFSNCVFIILRIVLFISGIPILWFSIVNSNNVEVEKKQGVPNKNWLFQAVVHIVIMLGLVLFAYYIILKFRITIAVNLLIVVGILMMTIAFFASTIDIISFVFLKPYKAELTEKIESSFLFFSIVCYFAFEGMLEENMFTAVGRYLISDNQFLSDLIRMLALSMWFFVTIFIVMVLFMIAIKNYIIIFEKWSNRSEKTKTIKDSEYKELEISFWSNGVLEKIQELPRRCWIRRFLFCCLWLLCAVIDGAKNIVVTFCELVHKLLYIIFKVPKAACGKVLGYINSFSRKNHGRIIVVGSRVALISSLVIVFLLDKYKGIFSESGSNVYEFMCSVIIIPFLITQIDNLKSKM